MSVVTLVLLFLQCGLSVVSGGDDREHVHFKIYVPEIIKHHLHTKTVFIHIHDPKKKPPPKKNEHVESHHEDWNIWSNQNVDDEHDNGPNVVGHRLTVETHNRHPLENLLQHRQRLRNQGYATSFDGLLTSSRPSQHPIDNAYPLFHRERPEVPGYDDHQPNYQSLNDNDNRHRLTGNLPVKSFFRNGVTGYSYPPQYAVEENVMEDGPEDSHENYKNVHEEGHSKRLHSEIGHLYTNDLTNFYDDKNEESHEALSLESKESDENKNLDSYRHVGDQYLTTRMMITR